MAPKVEVTAKLGKPAVAKGKPAELPKEDDEPEKSDTSSSEEDGEDQDDPEIGNDRGT